MVRSIVLRGFDQDMAERIRKHMSAKGIKFIYAIPIRFEQLKERTEKEPGRVKVHYQIVSDKNEKQIVTEEYDTVLLAIGRDAKTQDLGLEKIGVELAKNGKVMGRREQSRTLPYVYAVGDVLEGAPELTPVAIQAGKVLMRRIFTGNMEIVGYYVYYF